MTRPMVKMTLCASHQVRGIVERGSLLILVMWVLMIVSVFAVSVGYAVRQKLQAVGRIESREQLRLLADAGVQKALAVLRSNGNGSESADCLNDPWSLNEKDFKDISLPQGVVSVSYEASGKTFYGMIDEESKININIIDSPAILALLLQRASGASDSKAVEIAQSILDWKDADDETHSLGAESSYYLTLDPPYRAKNGPFDFLDELLFVRGFTPAIYAKIRSHVTLASTGKLNLNTASEIVLSALGLPQGLVKKILLFRLGMDGVERTKDDRCFLREDTLIKVLDDFNKLEDGEKTVLTMLLENSLASTYSENFSVRSIAALDHRKEMLEVNCIVDKEGAVSRFQEVFYRPDDQGGNLNR